MHLAVRTIDFDYPLPEELIADRPLPVSYTHLEEGPCVRQEALHPPDTGKFI